jgi:hypothetical protein
VPTGLADGLEVGVLYRASRPSARDAADAPLLEKQLSVGSPVSLTATLALRIMWATAAGRAHALRYL